MVVVVVVVVVSVVVGFDLSVCLSSSSFGSIDGTHCRRCEIGVVGSNNNKSNNNNTISNHL
jgi:hypothetical protein